MYYLYVSDSKGTAQLADTEPMTLGEARKMAGKYTILWPGFQKSDFFLHKNGKLWGDPVKTIHGPVPVDSKEFAEGQSSSQITKLAGCFGLAFKL